LVNACYFVVLGVLLLAGGVVPLAGPGSGGMAPGDVVLGVVPLAPAAEPLAAPPLLPGSLPGAAAVPPAGAPALPAAPVVVSLGVLGVLLAVPAPPAVPPGLPAAPELLVLPSLPPAVLPSFLSQAPKVKVATSAASNTEYFILVPLKKYSC
jgi:hypothetical protein